MGKHDNTTMLQFISGLELSEAFFAEAVRPILDRRMPGLVYSAALLGSGSEVMGFDTTTSMDHHWGPRLYLFLRPADMRQAPKIHEMLRQELPTEFRGIPTNFRPPDEIGVRLLEPRETGPVEHRVDTVTVEQFLRDRLGDFSYPAVGILDWLSFTDQRLLEVTSGAVFHDGLGELEPARRRLAYYPRDIWLYLLSGAWAHLSQIEAFLGRSGEVGDELGSRLITASLVHDVMRLAFLMERTYAPYAKWFGTAFQRLRCAAYLTPHLEAATRASLWRERELYLSNAYRHIATMHNELKLTAPLSPEVSRFHGRQFQVIHGGRFASALWEQIEDAEVKALPFGVGSLDQFVDSTDVLSSNHLRARVRAVYGSHRESTQGC